MPRHLPPLTPPRACSPVLLIPPESWRHFGDGWEYDDVPPWNTPGLPGLTAPYTGTVDLERVYYTAGSRQERLRETATARITFVLRDRVANAVIP